MPAPHLDGVFLIVQAQTPDCPHILYSQRREKKTDIGDLICHLMLAEDVARDDAGLPRLAHISNTLRQQGVTVVDTPIAGQESNKTLQVGSATWGSMSKLKVTPRGGTQLPTENAGMASVSNWVYRADEGTK